MEWQSIQEHTHSLIDLGRNLDRHIITKTIEKMVKFHAEVRTGVNSYGINGIHVLLKWPAYLGSVLRKESINIRVESTEEAMLSMEGKVILKSMRELADDSMVKTTCCTSAKN